MTTAKSTGPQHCDEYYELLVELEEAIENGDTVEVAAIQDFPRKLEHLRLRGSASRSRSPPQQPQGTSRRREAGMTQHQAKLVLRQYGITFRCRDGEYRVNYLNGREETAYYTNDIEDAVSTGTVMARELNQ